MQQAQQSSPYPGSAAPQRETSATPSEPNYGAGFGESAATTTAAPYGGGGHQQAAPAYGQYATQPATQAAYDYTAQPTAAQYGQQQQQPGYEYEQHGAAQQQARYRPY